MQGFNSLNGAINIKTRIMLLLLLKSFNSLNGAINIKPKRLKNQIDKVVSIP